MSMKITLFAAASSAALLCAGCLPIEGLDFAAKSATPASVPYLTNLTSDGFSPATSYIMAPDVPMTDVDSSGTFYRINGGYLQTRVAGSAGSTAWTDFPGPVQATYFCIERAASGDVVHVFERPLANVYRSFQTNGTEIGSATSLSSSAVPDTSSLSTDSARVRKASDGTWYFFSTGSADGSPQYHVSADFMTSIDSSFSGLSTLNYPDLDTYYPAQGDFGIHSDGTLWVSICKTGSENQGFAVLNADGTFKKYVGGGSVFAEPWGFDFDSSGNLYVYNRKRNNLEVYAAGGTKLIARADHVGSSDWASVASGMIAGSGPKAKVTVVGNKVYVFTDEYVDVFATYGN